MNTMLSVKLLGLLLVLVFKYSSCNKISTTTLMNDDLIYATRRWTCITMFTGEGEQMVANTYSPKEPERMLIFNSSRLILANIQTLKIVNSQILVCANYTTQFTLENIRPSRDQGS